MSYFAPYFDGDGLHMPSYDDRVEELWSAYCNIFGVDPETSADTMDYQYIMLLASALDDAASLIADLYRSCCPGRMVKNDLVLYGTQFGLIPWSDEEIGDTDILVRNCLPGSCHYTLDALKAGLDLLVAREPSAKYRLYVNDTDAAVDGFPPHSVALVVHNLTYDDFIHLMAVNIPVGIYTHGNSSYLYNFYADDLKFEYNDNDLVLQETYRYTTAEENIVAITVNVNYINAALAAETAPRIKKAVMDYINSMQIGEPLYVQKLGGVIYTGVDNDLAANFAIRSITAQKTGSGGSAVTDVVNNSWYGLFYAGNESASYVTVNSVS